MKVDPDNSAVRIRAEGEFHLELPRREAFELFTAAGEERWIADWRPLFFGKRQPQQPGLVFITGSGSDETIWTVIHSDRESGRLAYSRVTPASRAGVVEVTLREEGGGTLVRVTYDLTALNHKGAIALKQFAPGEFTKMMISWKGMIETCLQLNS